MMPMHKPSEATRRREPDVDLPGQDYRLSNGFSGRVRCGRLFVEAGVRADGIVEADKVFIYGEYRGVVDADLVTVFEGGVLVGHSRSEQLKVAGRACGLLHARRIAARDGAMIEGEVVADILVRQDSTVLRAGVSVGPGCYESAECLEAARKRMDVPAPPARSSDRTVLALAPAVAPKAREPEAIARTAPPARKVPEPQAPARQKPKTKLFLIP